MKKIFKINGKEMGSINTRNDLHFETQLKNKRGYFKKKYREERQKFKRILVWD